MDGEWPESKWFPLAFALNLCKEIKKVFDIYKPSLTATPLKRPCFLVLKLNLFTEIDFENPFVTATSLKRPENSVRG